MNSPEITKLTKPTYWKTSAHLKPVLNNAVPFILSALVVFSKPLLLFLGAILNLSAFCHFGRQDRTLRPRVICTEQRANIICVLTHRVRWTGRAAPIKKLKPWLCYHNPLHYNPPVSYSPQLLYFSFANSPLYIFVYWNYWIQTTPTLCNIYSAEFYGRTTLD